ncbi:dephospho-CoA kinase [Mycobacterium hubeiense]|uniref:dephospho-CoA kinase n=1 Tax=Mycobacterium hubeiense TaxID=1867256 RepID=UPI000C7F1207|nr:dephospho-CoA kinase [Mycobacterium sp. QGD 101]
MLRIGLTGGIGAGKSTVSAAFSECGGIIVDGDVIAREVVEPGTEGLAQLVDAFGEDILLPDGALNRPALAAKAFVDDEQRAKLNGIVHPLVGRRRQEIIDSVSGEPEKDTVVVEDNPLLVETGMAPMFPLVVVVTAPVETRVERLIKRGMDEADARARIAAQASEEQRREIADVLLDNSGSQGELIEKARDLWYNRVLPLAHNIRTRQPVEITPRVVPYNPAWPDDARRIIKRLHTACGSKALRVDHIGSTAVAGMDAKDVIDIQVTVSSLEVADDIAEALAGVGYPRKEEITNDVPKIDGRSTVAEFDHTDDASLWQKRFHAAADPGRPANVHIRVDGWPNQQFALLFVDWLAANPGVQEDYRAVKQAALRTSDYVEAKEPWFLDAYRRAWEWADATGWRP